jgi:hypothetical protein
MTWPTNPELLRAKIPTIAQSATRKAQYYFLNDHVCWRGRKIVGADASSFVYFEGSFAKDTNRVYRQDKRIAADPASFWALNFCWFADKDSVWALGGQLTIADPSSFEVCDDGYKFTLGCPGVPKGYARDASGVYYYGFEGQPGLVKKADPATFKSMNNSLHGSDISHVYYKKAVLKTADPASWEMIGGYYARDHERIFYDNREIPEADYESFRVTEVPYNLRQLARDRNGWFENESRVGRRRHDKILREVVKTVRSATQRGQLTCLNNPHRGEPNNRILLDPLSRAPDA